MMMYNVNEEYILSHWALETIIKKTKNGFNFLLLQRGVILNEEEKENKGLSDDDIIALFS